MLHFPQTILYVELTDPTQTILSPPSAVVRSFPMFLNNKNMNILYFIYFLILCLDATPVASCRSEDNLLCSEEVFFRTEEGKREDNKRLSSFFRGQSIFSLSQTEEDNKRLSSFVWKTTIFVSLQNWGREQMIVFLCSKDNLLVSLSRTEEDNKRLSSFFLKTWGKLPAQNLRSQNVGNPTNLERALMWRPSIRPASVKSQEQRPSPDASM